MKSIRVLAMFGLLVALALTVAAGGESDDEFKTHDDLLLDVGRRIPEFGGMFLSEDNSILYVYVTDGSQDILGTEEVKQAIGDVLKASATQRRELRLIPAKYSMLQLYGWYSRMQAVVFRHPNVVMTDLDEGQNRIEIGVDSLDAVESLEASLASLDIPSKAVIIQVRERPTVASHTLQDRASGDEIEGGYQIQATGVGGCTLGFNVVRSGEAGFITAGHCTESGTWDGGVDGTLFYQPSSTVNPTAIGEETIDPPFSSSHPQCESGEVCRYSDSAFVRLAPSGVSQNLGKIAKTTALGSITVDHSTKFRIVGEDTLTTVGETIHKVGRTTGWITATITNTCVRSHRLGGGVLICQDLASGDSDGGDSGAPVFRITDTPSQGDVELLGISWGGGDSGGDSWFVISPIGNIYIDLGSTDTWEACDPSFSC